MKKGILWCAIGLSVAALSSCSTYDEVDYIAYNPYPSDYRVYSGYQSPDQYYVENYKYQQVQTVHVPETYHVGSYHAPVSFKDRDKTWVSGQNPQNYTIEVAEGEQAADVANQLYKAPKSDRRAQVKYQRNGKAYYKGVYGSYNSAEDAKKALDALPADVRKKAGVKNWGAIQQGM